MISFLFVQKGGLDIAVCVLGVSLDYPHPRPLLMIGETRILGKDLSECYTASKMNADPEIRKRMGQSDIIQPFRFFLVERAGGAT